MTPAPLARGDVVLPEVHEELMCYVKAGHLLALVHSQARQALKKPKVS